MTMKKINSIAQLRAEKQHLKKAQEATATKIHANWAELKASLHIKTITQDMMPGVSNLQPTEIKSGRDILKTTLNYGLDLLVRKFANNASEKIYTFLKK